MIVSHKHRFIFLKTRKTGGTSIELALRSICGDDDIIAPVLEDRRGFPGRTPQNYLFKKEEWAFRDRIQYSLDPRFKLRANSKIGFYNHMRAAEVRSHVGEAIWNSYFKFSVERNPWDREVSLYYWRTSRTWLKKPSFQDFVHQGTHVRNWNIYSISDAVVADHVIRYTPDIDSALASTLDQIGVAAPITILRAKSSSRPRIASYQELYDEHTKEVIRHRYQREIDFFGWEF